VLHRVVLLKTGTSVTQNKIYKYILFHLTFCVQHKLYTVLHDASSFTAQQQQLSPVFVYWNPQTVCLPGVVMIRPPWYWLLLWRLRFIITVMQRDSLFLIPKTSLPCTEISYISLFGLSSMFCTQRMCCWIVQFTRYNITPFSTTSVFLRIE
jgi:hypothetical protein